MEQQLTLDLQESLEQRVHNLEIRQTEIEKRQENLRKGFFRRHAELEKKYMENVYEFEKFKEDVYGDKSYENQGYGCQKILPFNFSSRIPRDNDSSYDRRDPVESVK